MEKKELTTEERIRKIEENQSTVIQKLDKVILAICGDPVLGIEGLNPKLERHDKHIEKEKEFKFKLVGIFLGVSIVVNMLIKFWDKIF